MKNTLQRLVVVWSLMALILLPALAHVAAGAPLSVNISAAPDPVQPGGQVTYSITVTNSGSTDLTAVRLAAKVPTFTSVSLANASAGRSCSSGSAITCSAGQEVRWSFASLPFGQPQTFFMTATVDSGATGAILETATINDGSGNSATAQLPVTVAPAGLALMLTADRNPVGASALLTYTLLFGNAGADAAPDTLLTAMVPGRTTFISASDGVTPVDGVITWSLGSVGSGNSGVRQFTVSVDAAAMDGTVLLSDADLSDTAGHIARAHSVTTVRSPSPLTLSLTASLDPVRPGGQVTYTFTIANNGEAELESLNLAVKVPAFTSVSLVNASAGRSCSSGSAITCSAGQEVRWSPSSLPSLSSLAPGQSRTFVVTADTSAAAGTLILEQAAVADGSGKSAIAQLAVAVAPPVLALTMTAERNPVEAGASLTYTLLFANAGTEAASDAVLIATVPNGTSFTSASGGITPVNGVITWSLGSIGSGNSGRRQLTVRVDATARTGSMLLSNAGLTDTAAHSARASAATAVRTPSLLNLSITACPDAVQPRSQVSYTFTITNRGDAALSSLILAVKVPPFISVSLSNASFDRSCSSGSAITCSAGQEVRWSFATLPAGQSQTFSMAADVIQSATSGTVIPEEAIVIDGSGNSATAAVATRVCALGGTACDQDPPRCCGDADGTSLISTSEATKAILALINRDPASDPAAQCTACGVVTTADATKVILNLVNRTCNP